MLDNDLGRITDRSLGSWAGPGTARVADVTQRGDGVQRLAGSDAGFLFVEAPTMTSVCVDLLELDTPPAGAAPLTVHDLAEHLAERLHLVPSLRWRLEAVPLGLHHPEWIDDPDFDLGYHVRQARVAAPGGPAELDALLAEVLPGLLDLRHPLWQVVLVDGLAEGRQALVFRFHHAIADGAALLRTLDLLFGPHGGRPPEPIDRRGPTPPKRRTVLRRAFAAQLRNWWRAPRLLRTTLRRFKAVEARREEATVAVPRAMDDAPPSILNASFTAERTYARAILPLDRLQVVRRSAGTALSDVVLAVVAGGLRTYLGARDQLPDRPLVANVPVANDPPGAPPRQHGNRFANFFTTLATDVADPRERLAAIAAGSTEAKLQLDVQGRDTLPDWLDRLPPAIAAPAARGLARRSAKHPESADFSVLVSNVRATDPDWTVGGRRVVHAYMSGPVADGAGLNVTITGFGGNLHLAVVATPDAVAEPRELVQAFAAALDELEATCTG